MNFLFQPAFAATNFLRIPRCPQVVYPCLILCAGYLVLINGGQIDNATLSPFRNEVGSFTLKMENTNLSTSLFELSYHFITLISGNQ